VKLSNKKSRASRLSPPLRNKELKAGKGKKIFTQRRKVHAKAQSRSTDLLCAFA
jgi:hypothetical protein